MSEPSSTRRRIWAVGLILSLTVLILPMGIFAGGNFALDTCTLTNGFCSPPIKFHTIVAGNTTALPSTSLTSTSWSAISNETMVVISANPNLATVQTISDLAGDTFTRRFIITGVENLEIWTAQYHGATSFLNSISVSWNESSMFLAAMYLNVAGFGNTTGTSGSATSGSFTLTTLKSGSWIVGGVGLPGFSTGQTTCAGARPTPNAFLIQRVYACSGVEPPSGINMNNDISDNATSLRNNFVFTYSETFAFSESFAMGAIELVASDLEPLNPNFNNFCTTTNGLCVTSQYSINHATQNGGPNSGTITIAPSTAYCTGFTSFSMTTTGHDIFFQGEYGYVVDRNITTIGPTLQVTLYLTTVSPSTSFGAGQCSASQSYSASNILIFASFGGLTANNRYYTSVAGACPSTVCGTNTYYLYFEITPYNFVGHMQFNQVGAGSLGMFEAK